MKIGDHASVQSDIELVMDAGRLFGHVPDADKIALHVHRHHPDRGFSDIRQMVLNSLQDDDPDLGQSPPWGKPF